MKRREAKGLDNKGKQQQSNNGIGGSKKRQRKQRQLHQHQHQHQRQVEDNDSDSDSVTSETDSIRGKHDLLEESYRQNQQLLQNQTPPPRQRLLLDVSYKTTTNDKLIYHHHHNNRDKNTTSQNLCPLLKPNPDLEHNQQDKQQQQTAIMGSRSSSDNNFISKQHHFEEAKNDKMTYCFRGKWILLLSMSLTLIITAVLVAILTINLLDNQDTCFQNIPFQQPAYRLFSTKTSYSTAFSYLNLQSSDSNSLASSPIGITKPSVDKSSIELPSIFSKSDSLKTIHDRLTTNQVQGDNSSPNCKVKQFHYFGRHAARFPSSKNIDQINQLVSAVQNKIDLSKFSSLNNASNNNNNINNPNNATSANSTNVCFNPLAPYKQWAPFATPNQGNLIIDSGIEDTDAIALRLKSIYPDFFNSSKTKIEIGCTEELRTAQTALVFLKHFDDFKLDFCSLDQFPTENVSDQAKADEIRANECFNQFIKKFYKEKLAFHKKCDDLQKVKFPLLYHLNLKEPNKTEFIANSVSKKLKLSKEDYLSPKEVDALYKICSYETALSGSSIWCSLFSDSDLKFYEYISDVDDFFNQAYGHPDQSRSACPVTSELMKAFKTVKQQFDANRQQTAPEAYFYFTHSEVIQKILAASVDLEQDPQYQPSVILDHLRAGTSPKIRQWRTSIFTPFSANLAFTLYECSIQNSNTNYNYNNGEYTINVNQSPFKVIASLNEQPIKLDGCADYVCDLNELMNDSRIDKERRCKLEDICRKKIELE